MEYSFSKSMEALPFSKIRVMMEEANRMERDGQSVIHLELGRPDFVTPKVISDACVQSLEQGDVFYTSNYGLPPLRQAIANKLYRDNDLAYQPEEILVTVGLSEAIYCCFAALLEAGDEVLVPDPGWLNYFHVPRFFGATPVSYPLDADRGFEIDPEVLEKLVTPRTKAIVLISPHNPTGAVLGREVLQEVARIAIQNNLYVFSDEIYEKLIYDEGVRHISIASLEGMKERTLTLNGFSKAYSMTGWRLGYVAADQEIINVLVRAHQHIATCAVPFVQKAGIAALEKAEPDVRAMVGQFRERRDYIAQAINAIPGLSCLRPKGAFYLFVAITGTGMTSDQAAEFFLRKAHVALVTGRAFGSAGEGYLRLSYASGMQELMQAASQMEAALAGR